MYGGLTASMQGIFMQWNVFSVLLSNLAMKLNERVFGGCRRAQSNHRE